MSVKMKNIKNVQFFTFKCTFNLMNFEYTVFIVRTIIVLFFFNTASDET